VSGEHGSFSGYGSVFGVVDLGAEVVDAGAFSASLAEFRRSGLILWHHDRSRPVAMPVVAREDRFGLWLQGDFHSTPDAQAARAIVGERLANGFSYGLSIGYIVRRDAYVKGIRHLVTVDLLEVSLVAMPMLPVATVNAVKGAVFGEPVPLKATAATPAGPRMNALQGEILQLTGQARALGVPVDGRGRR
jgi:HK97 family phage prohead protease